MKRFNRIAAWVLALCLFISMAHLPAMAATNDLTYIHSTIIPNDTNDMFLYSPAPGTPEGMDPTKGTHLYVGSGNFSRFASAHVCLTGYDGEEPVCYDENGTPYYVQADHGIFEGRKLYVDDYYLNGNHVFNKCYARWDYIQQFVLADTVTGKLATTYCADQKTSAEPGYYYTIENVEDADYYDAAQATKIRSIALNGYWGADSGLGSLAAMKEKLTASGEFTEAEIAALTEGIAMTATQYAIWQFSNHATGDKPISAYYVDDDANINRLTDDQKGSVDLLFKVYDYLLALEPTASENTTADTIINKDNFLTNLAVTPVKLISGHENNLDDNKDNDAYIANLSFVMDVIPSTANGDNLVATVADDNGNVLAIGRVAGALQEGEVQLVDNGNGKFTFTGLELTEGTQHLNMQLVGKQYLKQGVYLYTSEVKDGVSSQTFVGIAEGSHQVNVSMDYEVDFYVEEPPMINFPAGGASNISFMLVDPDGNVEFLYKLDLTEGDTSVPVEVKDGYISAVFVKQAKSGMLWVAEEVDEDVLENILECLKQNNPSYSGHNAVAFGEGSHKLTYANGKKNKTVTYTFG